MKSAACLVALVLACGTLVHAHEIGTTRVSARFQDGRRYDIEVVTDASSLVDKLTALAGLRTVDTAALSPAALGERLVALDDIFRQRVVVSFDGAVVRPAIQYAVTAAPDAVSPMLATIRLTGEAPRGARHFTWLYSWTFASYALSLRNVESAEPTTEWLEGGQASTPFAMAAPPPPVSRATTAWRYLTLGYTHILPKGLDHILFVLGLFLLTPRLRPVLAQVTAFTVAHSITLGLTLYGLVSAPATVVEPLIAISIAYVAIENLFTSELKPWRIALVFAFGLLHGMGFAGALQELGLPRSEFLTALLTFNVGVEAGQLSVIAAAVIIRACAPTSSRYQRFVVQPASALIALAGSFWTLERLL